MTGYVSGQQVSVNINVNNDSNVEVNEVAVELVKIVHYNSDIPRMKTRVRKEHVTVSQGAGVAVKTKSSTNLQILIPAVPPTNIGTCRVLSIFYEINVIAKVGAFHRDAVLRIPIMIGTVPLISGFIIQNAPQLYPNLNASMLQPSTVPPLPIQPSTTQSIPRPAPTAPNQAIQDMPPPSYQEAMSLSSVEPDNEEGLNDQQPFNPQYPVFNFANYGIQPPHAQPASQSYQPTINVPQFPPDQYKQKF